MTIERVVTSGAASHDLALIGVKTSESEENAIVMQTLNAVSVVRTRAPMLRIRFNGHTVYDLDLIETSMQIRLTYTFPMLGHGCLIPSCQRSVSCGY
jgi:hypothetical protein